MPAQTTDAPMTSYRISPNVLSSQLGGEAIVLNLTTQRYCRLNTTAAAVWSGIERGLEPEAVVAELCDTLEVDRPVAAAAVDRLYAEFTQRELLQPVAGPRSPER